MGDNEIMTHLTSGAVIVYALQWAKSIPQLSWISADSGTVNRALSGLFAAAIAFGITASGNADTGWTIHIPSAAALTAGAWEWVKQFTVQQVVYDGVVQKAGKVAP